MNREEYAELVTCSVVDHSNLDSYDVGYKAATESADARWQPIDTAPKNGTEILTYRKCGLISVAAYFGMWVITDGMTIINVTHWMPLPEAPKGELK